MRQRHPERLADYLRSGGRSEKLAAAARRGAGAAQSFGRGLERDLPVREAGAGRLDLARVFVIFGKQRDTAGDEDGRKVARGGQRHHHGGEALVAGRDTEHAGTRGQRADQPAEDRSRVVAVGQRIEHSGGALGAAVARIGAIGRERDGAARLQLFGRGVHQQADFPMACVIAERHGRTVGRADSAVRAEDQELLAAERRGLPAHAGILAPAKEVARGTMEQHLRSNRERARGSRRLAANIVQRRVGGFENVAVHRGHDIRTAAARGIMQTMRVRKSWCTLLLLAVAAAAAPKHVVRENIEWLDVWLPDTNSHDLPRVLLIGDSITRGYGKQVEALLKGKAYVGRMATSKSLGDPALLDEVALILKEQSFDVIHFNNGMHGDGYNEAEYAAALPDLISTLHRHAPHAKLIWASTTDVRRKNQLEQADPKTERVVARNRAAAAIVAKSGIPVDDLFAVVDGHPEFHAQDGVHFNEQGYAALAARVAKSIEPLLAR